MSDLPGLLLLSFMALGLIALGWWLIFETEGVYLGRRTVVWLYDRYANRYDEIKQYQPEYERWLLAHPIMTSIQPHRSPLVLDVATGTGRLPLALVNHPDFHGHVIGLDLSRRMLQNAARKLPVASTHVSLIWGAAETLPFEDNLFDVIACLESLEFMENPKRVLRELARVLRPGGLLLLSNRINTRLMPGKIWSEDELRTLLYDLGVEQTAFEPWQQDYAKVWGEKSGKANPKGARPLAEILRCPRCPDSLMIEQHGTWVCETCNGRANIGVDGVINLYPLQNPH